MPDSKSDRLARELRAREEYREKLLKQLQDGVGIQEKEGHHFLDLSRASQQGLSGRVSDLLKQGVEFCDKDGSDFRRCTDASAMHGAAVGGHLSVLETLIEGRADLQVQSHEGHSAMHGAASKGHTQAVQLLLKHHADPTLQSKEGETPMHLAARRGHPAILELLIEHLAFPDITNKDGNTPLRLAACYGHRQVVRLLVKKRADFETKDESGQAALHGAAANGHIRALKLLLENAANPYVKDTRGSTPLHLAATGGHRETLVCLCEKRADPHLENYSWKSSIALAKEHFNQDCTQFLESVLRMPILGTLDYGDFKRTPTLVEMDDEAWPRCALSSHEKGLELPDHEVRNRAIEKQFKSLGTPEVRVKPAVDSLHSWESYDITHQLNSAKPRTKRYEEPLTRTLELAMYENLVARSEESETPRPG